MFVTRGYHGDYPGAVTRVTPFLFYHAEGNNKKNTALSLCFDFLSYLKEPEQLAHMHIYSYPVVVDNPRDSLAIPIGARGRRNPAPPSSILGEHQLPE